MTRTAILALKKLANSKNVKKSIWNTKTVKFFYFQYCVTYSHLNFKLLLFRADKSMKFSLKDITSRKLNIHNTIRSRML